MKTNLPQQNENLLLLLTKFLEYNGHQMQELIKWLKAHSKSRQKNILDTAELKQEYHISDSTIYRLRKSGKLSFTKLGNKYLYSRSAIEKLLNEDS